MAGRTWVGMVFMLVGSDIRKLGGDLSGQNIFEIVTMRSLGVYKNEHWCELF